jgi:hypothetical protein
MDDQTFAVLLLGYAATSLPIVCYCWSRGYGGLALCISALGLAPLALLLMVVAPARFTACPHCKGKTPVNASACKHCGRDLEPDPATA